MVIYYKGRMTDKSFANSRLSINPHYFGVGVIGTVTNETGTTNYYAEIRNFQLFSKAVEFKINGETLELIPQSKILNYWRDGVRAISEEVYNKNPWVWQFALTK